MIMPCLLALSIIASQASAPGNAQGQDLQSPPDVVDDVVVRGASRDAIGRFVGGVTVPGEHGQFQGQVARWGSNLCVSVVGGLPEVNAYLTGQITANFRSLDIPHADPGCEPTVAVVISNEADAFAQDYANRMRNRMFENRREAVARFVGPPRPVRWRHAVRTGPVGQNPRRDPLGDQRDALIGRLPGSRLKVATARGITQAMVVVDAERASGAPLDALAAYIAFVTVLDLPADPEIGAQRTILSLFDEAAGADRAKALTRWDRAFITALYGMNADRTFGFQQSEIESRMRRALQAPVN